jgi:hypothetical protein
LLQFFFELKIKRKQRFEICQKFQYLMPISTLQIWLFELIVFIIQKLRNKHPFLKKYPKSWLHRYMNELNLRCIKKEYVLIYDSGILLIWTWQILNIEIFVVVVFSRRSWKQNKTNVWYSTFDMTESISERDPTRDD